MQTYKEYRCKLTKTKLIKNQNTELKQSTYNILTQTVALTSYLSFAGICIHFDEFFFSKTIFVFLIQKADIHRTFVHHHKFFSCHERFFHFLQPNTEFNVTQSLILSEYKSISYFITNRYQSHSIHVQQPIYLYILQLSVCQMVYDIYNPSMWTTCITKFLFK